METIDVDATIIGGGIIGLAIALELKTAKPHWEIALIEQAPYLGDHSTGRNSGVLHAGLYYPTGSMKHLLCLEGIERWKSDYCPSLGIEFLDCGKVLFASDSTEESGLDDLWNQANKNGVKGLRWSTEVERSNINKYVQASKAFFSTGTGILDVTGAIKKISEKFESFGGMISKNCKVTGIENNSGSFKIATDQFNINSSVLINSAGFWGPEIRSLLKLEGLKSSLVKGNYISTFQKLDYPHLFYPVPPKDLKGLGVHSTLDMQGKTKFGPNTEDVTKIDYSDSNIALKAMLPAIVNKFKNINPDMLYWDYAGIRSKIINTDTGKLETDFWIKSPINGYIECLGIESPGLTSAPAIAKKIYEQFIA